MKNLYLTIGTIVVIVLVVFFFISRKTEAPIQKLDTETKQTVAIQDGSYRLDTSSSTLSWKGEYLTGLSEKGTVSFKSGEFKVEEGIITEGQFAIDMNTIESDPSIDKLVTHLKSDDFFAVATYPTATFVFKKMLPISEEGTKAGRYVIAGDLTVKGITKPISFIATLGSGENTLGATASFAINRADWEVKYNSPTFFKNIGDKIIRDAVEIELDLQAEKVIQ